jgi:hypothetical protein
MKNLVVFFIFLFLVSIFSLGCGSNLTGDTTPPVFRGLITARQPQYAAHEVDLMWEAASDNVSSPADIEYLIYYSLTSEAQNFYSPDIITSPGTTEYTVKGLDYYEYYFVVRARDEAGNIDNNTKEVSAVVVPAI